jgi:hypothetical protein
VVQLHLVNTYISISKVHGFVSAEVLDRRGNGGAEKKVGSLT